MAHTIEDLIIEIADKYTLNHSSENYRHNKEMLEEFYLRLDETAEQNFEIHNEIQQNSSEWKTLRDGLKENSNGNIVGGLKLD